MTYELAKELVDEGFQKPEHPKGQMLCAPHNIHDRSLEVYEPTLSELIEACGERGSFSLERVPSKGWRADFGGTERSENVGYFSTPYIAVARLWLALNGKQ